MLKHLKFPPLMLAALLAVGYLLAAPYLGLPSDHSLLLAGLVGIMTPAQARVINPILTTAAQGYKHPLNVGTALFPYVPVQQRGGSILTFGKEDFMVYNTARAPGANTKRIEFGYASGTYALEQHALEGKVPFELMDDARQVPGIDMGNMAVRKVQNVIALRLEQSQATIATTAGSYASANKVTLSGTGQWSDYTNGVSDPVANVDTAIAAVRAAIGLRANTVVMGAAVWQKLKNHPKVIDRIKYTGRDVATPELLASLFDVKRVLIGDAISATAAGVFSDVWGKFVVVAYTDMSGIADMGSPTYGYTYRLGGYPIVEQPYEDRNAKSWIYPVTDEVSPVMASAAAGFLISAVVA